jgi:hypothetical protein
MPEQTELFEYDEQGNPKPRRNLMLSPYPGKPAPGVRKSATSMAAAKLMDGKRAPLLSQIYHLLLGVLPDGLTDEEGQNLLSLNGNTYRPRRVELEEAGLVKDSLTTRPTASKRKAVVWTAVPIEDLDG